MRLKRDQTTATARPKKQEHSTIGPYIGTTPWGDGGRRCPGADCADAEAVADVMLIHGRSTGDRCQRVGLLDRRPVALPS
jgi:hypothetical protein